MRRVLSILICLCIASTALAKLSITNGDFEDQYADVDADIAHWYDYGGPDLSIDQGPYFLPLTGLSVHNGPCVTMGNEANTDEDGGNHAYVYQSIGIYEPNDPVAIEIELDWGLSGTAAVGGEMGVGVQILESNGAFVPCQFDGADCDIYGFRKTDEDPENPITVIGQASVIRNATKGFVMHERFQIDLTNATYGNELFLRFNNIKSGPMPKVQVDNITLSPPAVLLESPKDGANYVATELTSSENDLVFNVLSEEVISVDVLFSTDPNFPEGSVIIEDMTVTPGQYTITLEDELTEDLKWEREYFWQVLAYESDGAGGRTLRATSLVRSFTTIQYGPLLGELTPKVQAVWPGEDAVFTVPFHLKADAFQWYKEGFGALTNGADYAGVDTPTLTIFDTQTEDEGDYYLVGTETATGASIESENRGTLGIKELKTYYKFDTTYQDGDAVYTPDEIGDRDVELIGGASVVNSAGDPDALFDGYLSLRNPRGETHTQYAQIADTTLAHHKEITVSLWVKPSILDLDYERFARVFDFGQDYENYFYLTMLQHSNTASCHMTDDRPNDRQVDGVGDIGYGGRWVYVALTVAEELDEESEEEGDTFYNGKLYINGRFSGEGELYSPADILTPTNYFGKANAVVLDGDGVPTSEEYPHFDGLIDEFKIFNYAKTPEEIAREYMAVRTEVEYICNMDTYDLENLDYDDNCRVDLSDLAEIAEKWLQDYLVYSN